MKNKDIIFWTDIEGLPEIEPVTLSQNFIPEWFQKAPSFHSNQPGTLNRAGDGGTIKICPSFGDYFKMGYVVSLWCDLYIDFENEAEWQWRVPNNKYNFDLHPSWQYKDHLTEEAKKNIALILKAYCPWKVKTPKGVSLLQLPMTYHHDSRFSVMPGVIRTDLVHWINQQLIIYKKGETFIPKGTPLAMYVPMGRENYNFIVRQATKEDSRREEISYNHLKSKFLGGYKNMKRYFDK